MSYVQLKEGEHQLEHPGTFLTQAAKPRKLMKLPLSIFLDKNKSLREDKLDMQVLLCKSRMDLFYCLPWRTMKEEAVFLLHLSD